MIRKKRNVLSIILSILVLFSFSITSVYATTPNGTVDTTVNNTSNITVAPVALSLPGGIASHLPDCTVGTAYTANITATGGTPPYHYVASSLPAGLMMGTDGMISGTPIQDWPTLPMGVSGVTDIFTVSVTDNATPTARTVSQNFNITVRPTAGIPIMFGSHFAQPIAVVGTPYYCNFIGVYGGVPPYSVALASGSSLPAGLTLVGDGTDISGTPTESGVTSFTLTATDSAKPTARTGSQTFSLSVAPALSLPSATMSEGTVGTVYTAIIRATGGLSPYTYALASGSSLPAGLSLGTDGTINGTPTASGTTNFTVIATDCLTVGDSTARTASQTFSITVNPTNINTSGMTEMKTALPTVGPNKVWIINLNGLADETSITGNIYITNSKGIKQITTCTVTTANGVSQISVKPSTNYTPDDYILWVRDIKSSKGTKIKNQVYLKFTVQ